jgi:hypothetical protein
MDNVQKYNICSNVSSSQTFRTYIQYRVYGYNILPLDPILSHILSPYLFNVYFNIIPHLPIYLLNDLFLSGILTDALYGFFIFLMLSAYLANRIFIDLITMLSLIL